MSLAVKIGNASSNAESTAHPNGCAKGISTIVDSWAVIVKFSQMGYLLCDMPLFFGASWTGAESLHIWLLIFSELDIANPMVYMGFFGYCWFIHIRTDQFSNEGISRVCQALQVTPNFEMKADSRYEVMHEA
jgi:hypothetical protein